MKVRLADNGLTKIRRMKRPHKNRKANEGIRTLDLRFTKPLLYQLSYVGNSFINNILRLCFNFDKYITTTQTLDIMVFDLRRMYY